MPLHYDAFLFQSFGGPNTAADIIPFLKNVTNGRDIPPERIATVVKQYEKFGGKSPINEINLKLIDRLKGAFARRNIELPIYFGNRNFDPYVSDALSSMIQDGKTNAISFVTSAFGSYSGCKQYKNDVVQAQNLLGPRAPAVTKIRHFFAHPRFVSPVVDSVLSALAQFETPEETELVFSAHSIPTAMAQKSPYRDQLEIARNLVLTGLRDRTGVSYRSCQAFQSRSGPALQPWLEPDISDRLRELSKQNHLDVVVVPIGFVSEHLEVIYDLDVLAKATAQEVGINMVRSKTPSDSPDFVEMIADLTEELLLPGPPQITLAQNSSLNGCSPTCCD